MRGPGAGWWWEDHQRPQNRDLAQLEGEPQGSAPQLQDPAGSNTHTESSQEGPTPVNSGGQGYSGPDFTVPETQLPSYHPNGLDIHAPTRLPRMPTSPHSSGCRGQRSAPRISGPGPHQPPLSWQCDIHGAGDQIMSLWTQLPARAVCHPWASSIPGCSPQAAVRMCGCRHLGAGVSGSNLT